MPLAPLPTPGRIWPPSPTTPTTLTLFVLVLFQLALAFAGSPAYAQVPLAASNKTGLAKAPSPTSATKSGWSKLTPAQQVALGPLAPAWSGISEGQKRKWIALSKNYPALSDAERATLHGRMTEWAALSPAQRRQARLNFAQTKKLSTEEKKTEWQAYQALSPEQKKQLALQAKPKTVGAALAAAPVSPNKLASVPITRSKSHAHAAAAAKPPASSSAATSPTIEGAASAPLAHP